MLKYLKLCLNARNVYNIPKIYEINISVLLMCLRRLIFSKGHVLRVQSKNDKGLQNFHRHFKSHAYIVYCKYRNQSITIRNKQNRMQFVRAPRLVNVEQHHAMIIDTHGGIQDIIGIISAIHLSKLYQKQIIGITCVAGRRSVEQAATDALLAVKLCNAQIPIYKGASKPMMNKKQFPKTYNQSNKFYFVQKIKAEVLGEHIREEDKKLIQQLHAARFIAQSALKYKQNLSITTFGPLTNLAIAFHLQYKVKDIGIANLLGGQYTGVGNVVGQNSAEANFYFDPQATHIIMHNFKQNVYITPIQKVLQFDWKQKLSIVQKQPHIDEFKRAMLQHLNRYEHVFLGPLLAVFPAVLRKTLKKYYQVYSQVCMDGSMIQGLLAINWFRLDLKDGQQVPNIKICCEFDVDRMLRELIKSWCGVQPDQFKQ